MATLSSSGQAALQDIAQRHGFSVEATTAMLDAVARGNGSMAQFNHPEFGGAGQWMRGGMTMVGDMFNVQLKSWVDALCQDLSRLVATEGASLTSPTTGAFAGSDDWWPAGLGSPSASGSQNGARYAYFASVHRLAIQRDGRTTLYDTLDHRIGGVSQQQSTGSNLSFSSQHGPVDVSTLPVVTGAGSEPAPRAAPSPLDADPGHGDVFSAIEKLAALKDRGILGEGEFEAKKTELLKRV